MTHKEELVQLIITQYCKLYLNSSILVSANASEDSTLIEYRPFVISMKCGDVDILASKRSLPDIFFSNKTQKGHLYVVNIEVGLLLNCSAQIMDKAPHEKKNRNQYNVVWDFLECFQNFRKTQKHTNASSSDTGALGHELEVAFKQFGIHISKPVPSQLPAIVSSYNVKRRLRSHRKKKKQRITQNEVSLRIKELKQVEKLRNMKGFPTLPFHLAKTYLCQKNTAAIQHVEKKSLRLYYCTHQLFLKKAMTLTSSLNKCINTEEIFDWLVQCCHFSIYDAVYLLSSACFSHSDLKLETNAATILGQNNEVVQYANRGFGRGVLLGLLVDHNILSKDYVKKVIPF